jgi:hypothetical protein
MWTYQENDYMYCINGTCMQIYKWNALSNGYDIKNMISLTMACQIYPDIYEKYRKKDTPLSSLDETAVLDKFNTFHIE